MAEGALGHALAPGQLGPTEQAAEEANVKRIKDFIQIEKMALGAEEALAAASAANQLGLARDRGAGGKPLIAHVVRGVDGLLIELGDEDVSDGVDDGFGRAFKEVREADVQMAFAEANGGVERGESAKTDRDRGHGRARAEGPVFLLKDLDEFGGHHLQFTGRGRRVADDSGTPGEQTSWTSTCS